MANESAKCFILSQDLMFSSQVAGASSAAGLETRNIQSAQQVDGEAPLVVLDLTTPGLDIGQTVSSLKEANAKVVAVGPHVHAGKLELATQAGCDVVLTKGQASRDLGATLSALSKGEPQS